MLSRYTGNIPMTIPHIVPWNIARVHASISRWLELD